MLIEEMKLLHTTSLLFHVDAIYHSGIVYDIIEEEFCIIDILQEAVVDGGLILPDIYTRLNWRNGINSENITCEYIDFGVLTSIDVPGKFSGVKEIVGKELSYIGVNSFMCTKTLKKIDAPKVEVVASGAFMLCTELCDVNFGHLVHVGTNSFAFCGKLHKLNLSNLSSCTTDSFSGCVFDEFCQEDGKLTITLTTKKLIVKSSVARMGILFNYITVADGGSLYLECADNFIFTKDIYTKTAYYKARLPSYLSLINLGYVSKRSLGLDDVAYLNLSDNKENIFKTELGIGTVLDCARCFIGVKSDNLTIYLSADSELVATILKISFYLAHYITERTEPCTVANIKEFIHRGLQGDFSGADNNWRVECNLGVWKGHR